MFRRQFLLTNRLIEATVNWKHSNLDFTERNLHLYSHPDLEINHVRLQDRLIVLIGYLIDPFDPALSNEDILNRMINVSDLNGLFKETENLSGRFAILYCDSKGIYMFHDATGFREIYYCFHQGEIFCGSTPDIINKYAHMELDTEQSIKEFINSREYRYSGFWVGIRTPYRNIFHLMPNFYLDLDKRTFQRYWPDKGRSEIKLEEGVDLMARILKGTMLCAAKRYYLHQSLTAGYDTRLLLAAVKDMKDQVKFFVNRTCTTTNQVADIKIPCKLAAKFKFDLEVVETENINVDRDFWNIFIKNNVFAREKHLKVFYRAYTKGYDHTHWVTGTFGSEILRIAFPFKKKRITCSDIAKRFCYNNYRYVVNSIEDWLKSTNEFYSETGYNLMNMFYWEQYTGTLHNLSGSEGDIVREEIRPFNCRKLITTYISLPDKYRYRDYPKGYLMIIKALWKEILDVPIAAYVDSPSYWFKKALRCLGMELVVDNFYNYCKSRIAYHGK